MESPLLYTYNFRRRALNESWSGRTAKAGKNFKGNLKGAVQYALKLSKDQGGQGITIHNAKGAHLCLVYWNARVTIHLQEELLTELLGQYL